MPVAPEEWTDGTAGAVQAVLRRNRRVHKRLARECIWARPVQGSFAALGTPPGTKHVYVCRLCTFESVDRWEARAHLFDEHINADRERMEKRHGRIIPHTWEGRLALQATRVVPRSGIPRELLGTVPNGAGKCCACKLCDYVGTSQSNMNTHFRRIHINGGSPLQKTRKIGTHNVRARSYDGGEDEEEEEKGRVEAASADSELECFAGGDDQEAAGLLGHAGEGASPSTDSEWDCDLAGGGQGCPMNYFQCAEDAADCAGDACSELELVIAQGSDRCNIEDADWVDKLCVLQGGC